MEFDRDRYEKETGTRLMSGPVDSSGEASMMPYYLDKDRDITDFLIDLHKRGVLQKLYLVRSVNLISYNIGVRGIFRKGTYMDYRGSEEKTDKTKFTKAIIVQAALSEAEHKVFVDLCERQELSSDQLIKQALRVYQSYIQPVPSFARFYKEPETPSGTP